MDHVLELVTVNYLQLETMKVEKWRRQIMSQESFPFCIRDITLPQCGTGYAYSKYQLEQGCILTSELLIVFK